MSFFAQLMLTVMSSVKFESAGDRDTSFYSTLPYIYIISYNVDQSRDVSENKRKQKRYFLLVSLGKCDRQHVQLQQSF
ncbi:Mediator of RNA polymerase II transcription subunit [Trichinella spiralis]|uniref:Mediator of RNA polymerase II transcription subunit n=1 Tax=Trichinella spiralis TaxID=6334 RepID=A0ABR3KF60_TRISP